jgi:hypothetical protein
MIDELRDIEIRLEKLEETVSNLCCQVQAMRIRVPKKALATYAADDTLDNLPWWHKALENLRPPPLDDAILDDEPEKR